MKKLTFKKTISLGLCIISLLGLPILNINQAMAAPPMAKFSAPAFHRFMLGDFEITVINDGTDYLSDKLLQQDTDKTNKILAKTFLKSPVETSFNAYLIHTGEKLILIDTGGGQLKGKRLGNLLANIKVSGYQTSDIDEVYITHFHSDHLGGLIFDNQRAFPNAIVRADKNESDYWLSQDNMQKAPKNKQQNFVEAQQILAPYIKEKKYLPFNGNTQLQNGISAISTYGHTKGHTSYMVQSKGKEMLVTGDLVHVISVQTVSPKVTIDFDSSPQQAYEQRKHIFDKVADKDILIAGAHIPFPSVGHLRSQGESYEWIPLNYTRMY